MYYSHNFFSKPAMECRVHFIYGFPSSDIDIEQLADAMLPRSKYKFSTYLENVKTVAARLKALCEAGHIAERKHIMESVEHLNSGRHSSFKLLES